MQILGGKVAIRSRPVFCSWPFRETLQCHIIQRSAVNNRFYYVASSASEQNEPYPALRLTTRASKMELSCRSGLPTVSHKKNLPPKPTNKSFADWACSVKMAGYWPRSRKKELGQYSAILTSHLVNNPYYFFPSGHGNEFCNLIGS